MKKVQLEIYRPPNLSATYTRHKTYSVCLGSGKFFEFTSKRDCQAFLNQTSRFINLTMHELNDLLSQFYSHYRHIWFYLDQRPDVDRELKKLFLDVDQCFDKILRHTYGPNQNVIAFSYLEQITSGLIVFGRRLEKMAIARMDYAAGYRIRAQVRRLRTLSKQIEHYSDHGDPDHG